MNKTCDGGCQCGAVRYRITGELRTTYACHCTLCQRQSGSAFGMATVFGNPDVRWTHEAPSHYVRAGQEGSGRSVRCSFCPKCGTRLHHQWFTDAGDLPFVSVKTGTLDDTSTIAVAFHLWTQHKQPWVRLADGEEAWPQAMPAERFRSFLVRGVGTEG